MKICRQAALQLIHVGKVFWWDLCCGHILSLYVAGRFVTKQNMSLIIVFHRIFTRLLVHLLYYTIGVVILL